MFQFHSSEPLLTLRYLSPYGWVSCPILAILKSDLNSFSVTVSSFVTNKSILASPVHWTPTKISLDGIPFFNSSETLNITCLRINSLPQPPLAVLNKLSNNFPKHISKRPNLMV